MADERKNKEIDSQADASAVPPQANPVPDTSATQPLPSEETTPKDLAQSPTSHATNQGETLFAQTGISKDTRSPHAPDDAKEKIVYGTDRGKQRVTETRDTLFAQTGISKNKRHVPDDAKEKIVYGTGPDKKKSDSENKWQPLKNPFKNLW